MKDEEITVERLNRAIAATAYVMVRHNRPLLLATLKAFEAERDRLLQEGNAIDYARRIIAREGPPK